jgi:hypothetical protein
MLRMLRMLSKWWGRHGGEVYPTRPTTKRRPGQMVSARQHSNNNNAVDFTKSASEGQGDADFDAVGAQKANRERLKADGTRGLDNAGKTTIVKKIMGEDVNSVSPTLGFIIKTIEYDG